MRYQSAPYMNGQESPESIHIHQPSYETMTSGSDEMSKSTDPSSQNSSFDQLHQMSQRKQDGEQGTNPYRQQNGYMRNMYPPSAFPNGHNTRPTGPTDDYGIEFQPAAPPPPPKYFFPSVTESTPQNTNGARLQKTNSYIKEDAPKRQSWIKRTFSKRA
jgi:hypothetical protein